MQEVNAQPLLHVIQFPSFNVSTTMGAQLFQQRPCGESLILHLIVVPSYFWNPHRNIESMELNSIYKITPPQTINTTGDILPCVLQNHTLESVKREQARMINSGMFQIILRRIHTAFCTEGRSVCRVHVVIALP